jgi:hypothetical protein
MKREGNNTDEGRGEERKMKKREERQMKGEGKRGR